MRFSFTSNSVCLINQNYFLVNKFQVRLLFMLRGSVALVVRGVGPGARLAGFRSTLGSTPVLTLLLCALVLYLESVGDNSSHFVGLD